jgi:hypothetical protein
MGMEGWIGYDDYGVVDRLESEAIVTEFFSVVIPLWPSHSAYVARTREGEEHRIAIPLQPHSVVLGYLRVPLWMTALILGLPGMIDFARWGTLLFVGIALAVIASWMTFVAGRLDETERDRRALLRRVVGFGAPPELLPPGMRARIRDDLVAQWAEDSSFGWREAIREGIASEMLVAIAEYYFEPQLTSRARANLAADLRWN